MFVWEYERKFQINVVYTVILDLLDTNVLLFSMQCLTLNIYKYIYNTELNL